MITNIINMGVILIGQTGSILKILRLSVILVTITPKLLDAGLLGPDFFVLRDFLDKAVSDAVRASWGQCSHCLMSFDRQKNGTWSKNFHCSHFYSRGVGSSIRWYPDNLTALCGSCHKFLGGSPDEHTAFIKRILGDVCFESLRERKNKVMKYTKAEKREMAAHYREETKRIMALRDKGETGYISLVSWD